METLDPCKTCGGRAEYGEVPFDKSIPPEHQPSFGGQYIACAECGMSTNLVFNTMGDDVRSILREKWNRRAPSPAVLALVDACRNCWFDDEKQPERAIKEALAAVEREIGGA